jgi:ABC-2 type transport system permease protein
MFGGAAYFLVVAAVFSLAVGVLLRSTAGAVTVALSVLLLLPSILAFIRVEWVETLVSYLPLPASAAFLGDGGASAFGGEVLGAGGGLLVVTAYAVVPLVAAAAVLRRRDV